MNTTIETTKQAATLTCVGCGQAHTHIWLVSTMLLAGAEPIETFACGDCVQDYVLYVADLVPGRPTMDVHATQVPYGDRWAWRFYAAIASDDQFVKAEPILPDVIAELAARYAK